MDNNIFKATITNFLAPVLDYLNDPGITEIMINGSQNIFIERKGLIEKTNQSFPDEESLLAAVRNIAQFVGRPIDDKNPILDARLPDGSRIHAVIPPCARNGVTVAIRKFSKTKLSLKDLIGFGAISLDAARFIDVCLFLKKNIVVSGGTGSGKTTILGILCSRLPQNQRVLVIEDSSELQINSGHALFFETRVADKEGRGAVDMRMLVKSSLRLRPDRIILGEVRGGEALDLITAMNTGHGGSMGTTHANTPKETLIRLETLALMGGTDVPISAIRAQVSSAVNIIVQTSRMSDGSRKITHITEVLEMDEKGHYTVQDIYVFKQQGREKDGKIIGEIVPAGNIPTFMDEIELNRLPFGRDKFRIEEKDVA